MKNEHLTCNGIAQRTKNFSGRGKLHDRLAIAFDHNANFDAILEAIRDCNPKTT
jgi:hypothetical protein